MSRSSAARRLALAAAVMMVAGGLGACSGGIDRSEYTSPIAVTSEPAPAPMVPVVAPGGATRVGRQPLLPPVPDEQSGLGHVTVAQLLPPVVN